MDEFLLSAAAFVLLMVALGLVRVARGPGYADRMMAAQLLGTGAIGALLLVGAACGEVAVVDVALTLALLAAFASIAFVKFMAHKDRPPTDDEDEDLMERLLDLFSIVAIVAGAFFFLAGSVGLLRFPDAYTRLHALTKADNLGLALVVIGLLPQMDGVLAALKLVLVWLLVMLSSAAVSQLIAARAARRRERAELSDRARSRPERLSPGRAAVAGAGRCGRCWCAMPSWPSPASSPTGCCCRWCGCGCTASTSR